MSEERCLRSPVFQPFCHKNCGKNWFLFWRSPFFQLFFQKFIKRRHSLGGINSSFPKLICQYLRSSYQILIKKYFICSWKQITSFFYQTSDCKQKTSDLMEKHLSWQHCSQPVDKNLLQNKKWCLVAPKGIKQKAKILNPFAKPLYLERTLHRKFLDSPLLDNLYFSALGGTRSQVHVFCRKFENNYVGHGHKHE